MASLLLGDLNDHIEPSQACIKPVPKPVQTEDGPAKPVTINLTDCLACSGCITSAETVLVAQQTYSQLLDALDWGKYKQVIVSVAPQSLTSLAVKHKLGLEETWGKLNYFLKHILGVSRVLDVGKIRGITLKAMAKEYLAFKVTNPTSPFIVSACPGWVCYAEKRYTEMLPMMSRTRSPQQMAGVLVKHYMADYQLDEIYHCTVMPCFDKKLEASREDFMNDLIGDDCTMAAVRDVDTVITTTELVQIIIERCPVPFSELETDPDVEPLVREEGSSSDAYLHYVLHATIRSSFPHINGEVRQIQGRNADHTEFHFVDLATGKVLLRFAAIYGFKNIQTFVIKEKRRSSDGTASNFDFVEIMACPSGCLNGGGQLKPVSSEEEPAATRSAHKTHLAEMERVYRSVPTADSEDPLVSQFFNWVDEEPGRASLLQTQFRAVQDNTLKKTINVQW